ncbi:MAG: hypothetical protein RBR97_19635 [Bacteroidales bacterium]|nr:hypothetical protein [Bacteroidales bacterium]
MKKTAILIAVLFLGIMLDGCVGIFDTSTYWYEMPPEKIMINGNMVHNPDYDEYVKIYGNNPDASKPKRVYPTN